MSQSEFGLIGLGTMGQSLARNIARNGFSVAVQNRTGSVTEDFIKSFGSECFTGCVSVEELVAQVQRPRRIILMVPSGAATDAVIDSLLPHLEAGDVIADGGNAYYKDTGRRVAHCSARGVLFLGVGVSGGEEGALNGPSIMPGGPVEAWEIFSPMLTKIAADADGPCVAYVGPEGAGHFVKMVHNGIEYGEMQLIAEAYDLLRQCAALKPPQLAGVFESWNTGPLASFLIEITAEIFKKRDEEGSGYLVDVILDRAKQKGTGRWTAQEALDYGVAVSIINAAVDSRIISADKDLRVQYAQAFSGIRNGCTDDVSGVDEFVSKIHASLYVAKIVCYSQGMRLIKAASDANGWNINLSEMARIWKGGCIIRSVFLNDIKRIFAASPALENLMADPELVPVLLKNVTALREIVVSGSQSGIPLPALSAALSYLDSFSTSDLPLNLVQAQRDFFGAHTYERKDKKGTFHSDW